MIVFLPEIGFLPEMYAVELEYNNVFYSLSARASSSQPIYLNIRIL